MSQDWQAPFRILREQFLAAVRENFRVNLALASFPNHDAYRIWYERTVQDNLLREVTSPMNREPGQPTRVCAIGTVWGESEAVGRFDALAKEAGNSLPFDFYPANRLFPSFSEASNLNPGPVTLWSEFLFVTRSPSFRVQEDWPTSGCRIARLDGDPFLISATAIEQFLLASSAPDIGSYFTFMRAVCPWLTNRAGGFPMTPSGVITSPFLRFDLVEVLRSAVELGCALAARDAFSASRGSDGAVDFGPRFMAAIEVDRAVDVAAERLLCLLNPRQSGVREWSRQLDFAAASPDARQALRTLGLAVADIRGDWEESGRELLGGGAWHLWVGMPAEDQAAVRELLAETHHLWHWPATAGGEPGEYSGPRATLSDPRVIDHRWQTRRAGYVNQLHAVACSGNILVDTIRRPAGDYFDIHRDDVKGTRYSLPSICPQADPKPPVELRPEGDLLAEMECRFHDLGLIGPDESLHWVGRQDRPETRCRCELAPAQFYQPRPPEWRTLRDLRATIVEMMKLVDRYVAGRGAGLMVPTEELTLFDTIAERAYGLAQSLSIPLPPISNPELLESYPHGPVALPIHQHREGVTLSESDGRRWLSNWRAVRVGIDAQLARIDRAAQPDADADGVDTRDYPLDAPAGTPPPLREAFGSVARALFDAAEFRREPPGGATLFGEQARSLASRIHAANQHYAAAELQLQAVTDALGCAHQDALVAIRRVNDAVGHVILGSVAEHMAVAHIKQVPAPDVPGLLRRMRQQVSRAARAVQTPRHDGSAGAVTSLGTANTVPVTSNGENHPPRVRCDDADRSVYLDEKRIAGEVELPVYRFFKVIAEAYPDPISYKKIQRRAPGLHGKHRTRDLKDRLPTELARLVESGKHGYFLKLPAPK